MYEFKDLGVLDVESKKVISVDNDTTNEGYLMRARFENPITGAMYCAEFNDDEIRQFCVILNADPDLLDDFLTTHPNIKILSDNVSAEFSLRVGSKLYSFTIQIQKFVPEGSLVNIVQLHQKNNVLDRRIKTLEQRIDQLLNRDNDIIMLTDLCMHTIFSSKNSYPDEYIKRSIEIVGDAAHYFDTMVTSIKSPTDKKGTFLLEAIKMNKMPKLREYIVGWRSEIYRSLICGSASNVEYINRVLQFCQLGIRIDRNIMYEGNIYFFDKEGVTKTVKYTMIEYFNHQITHYIPNYDRYCREFTEFIDSTEYDEKCIEIQQLLTKLSN